MSRLVLRGLTKAFGKLTVVDSVDLALEEGEFVSLLGPSGCGKTTTLRMIAGFLEPTSGTIEMDGKLISSPGSVMPPERRQMSMIFQSYAIWPNMTVEENVSFGLKLRKLPSEEVRRRTAEILEIVQMSHLAGRYPAELSGGQQQRVALARAIVVKPSVLLLDEPLSNLDANLREEMRFEIRRLHERLGITIVYVTHDQAEALTMSDRIAVFHRGVIQQIDTPAAVYEQPRNAFVASFIGESNRLAGVVEAIDGAHCRVRLDDGTPILARPIDVGTGDATSVLLRPERITLADPSDPDGSSARNRLAAEIREVIYLGDHTRLRVSLAGRHDCAIKLPAGRRNPVPLPGMRVEAVFEAADCLAFRPE